MMKWSLAQCVVTTLIGITAIFGLSQLVDRNTVIEQVVVEQPAQIEAGLVEEPITWPCEEDEIIMGFGDFNGNMWTYVDCVPVDDVVTSEMGCPTDTTIIACAEAIRGGTIVGNAWSATPTAQGSEQ